MRFFLRVFAKEDIFRAPPKGKTAQPGGQLCPGVIGRLPLRQTGATKSAGGMGTDSRGKVGRFSFLYKLLFAKWSRPVVNRNRVSCRGEARGAGVFRVK